MLSPNILKLGYFNGSSKTDASAYGVGAVLLQVYDCREHVIYCISRSLTRQDRNYSATERELLAVLFAIDKLNYYLEGAKFSVICDHYSLQWLDNLKNPQGHLGRWALRLQQFDYTNIHRKGKDKVVADALSRSVPETCDGLVISNVDLKLIQDKRYKGFKNRILEDALKCPNFKICGVKINI